MQQYQNHKIEIHLSRYAQGLYSKNSITLLRERKPKLRNTPCSWIRRLNIFKMSILPNVLYRFKSIPIKIPIIFVMKIEKPTLKLIWHLKGLQIAKTILKNKNKVGMLTLPGFKTYY